MYPIHNNPKNNNDIVSELMKFVAIEHPFALEM